MSDRNCIFLNKNLSLSAAGLAFCCDSCGGMFPLSILFFSLKNVFSLIFLDGCNGGYPGAAWQYWVNTGIVEEGCCTFSSFS